MQNLGRALEPTAKAIDAVAACGLAGGVALGSSAADASTVGGLAKVAGKGLLASGGGGVARPLAREEVVRDLAPAAIAESNSLVREGAEQGARTATEYAAAAGTLASVSEAGGTETSGRDWVPVA
jgi:hypothetical protein